MKDNRKFKGIWIPREVWLDKNLTIHEKVMLVEIDSLDNENGCFARNQHFAEFLGVSERRIQTIIASLKDKGLISVEFIRKKGSKEIESRVLRVSKTCVLYSPPIDEEVASPRGEENFMGGGEENFAEVVKEAAPRGEENFMGGGEENFAEVVKEAAPRGEENFADSNTSFNNTGIRDTGIRNTPPAPSERGSTTALVPYEKIKSLYNEICKSFPKCTVMSETRKKAIRARLANGYTMSDIETLFRKAAASSFLKGNNKNNWMANFDWLIKDANMAKVLDGNYDDHKDTTPTEPKPEPEWLKEFYL